MRKCRNGQHDSHVCNSCEYLLDEVEVYHTDLDSVEWFEGDYIEAGMGNDDCMDFEPRDDNYYIIQEEELFGGVNE